MQYTNKPNVNGTGGATTSSSSSPEAAAAGAAGAERTVVGGGGEQAQEPSEMIRTAAAHELAAVASSLYGRERGDWETVKGEFLYTGLLAKFTGAGSEELREELMATETKTIAMLCGDKWAGISASGGIPTGKNMMGVALEQIRGELAASQTAAAAAASSGSEPSSSSSSSSS
mmetsp:Transcript_25818/g.35529  ORF Transcript_25818/g.35529 Transcript_25818/m.35529 type:complete len:173 (-) Transcript_25818:390-908(-)